MFLLSILLTLLPGSPTASSEDHRLAAARTFFAQYQELLHAFDPEVIEQYADDARIVNVRKYPAGLPDRRLELRGDQYKELARNTMALAKERGDRSEYSEITYTLEGQRVRIHATRYSVLKDYESPYSALVGPSEEGAWLIYEELSQSQP